MRLVDVTVRVVHEPTSVALNVHGLLGEHGVDGAGKPGMVGRAALSGRRRLRFGAHAALVVELPRRQSLRVAGRGHRLPLPKLLQLGSTRGLAALKLGNPRVEPLKLCPKLASR